MRLNESWRRGENGSGERWRVDWKFEVGRGNVSGVNWGTSREEGGIAEMKFIEKEGPECATEGHGMHMCGTQEWANVLLNEKAVDGSSGRSKTKGCLPSSYVSLRSAQQCTLDEFRQQEMNARLGFGPAFAWGALRSMHRREKKKYALGDVGVVE
jgi:hypothetical protein